MYNALRGLIKLDSILSLKSQPLVKKSKNSFTSGEGLNPDNILQAENSSNFLVSNTASINYLEFLEEPEECKVLISKTAEINVCELTEAIFQNDIKKVKFLVTKGANILYQSANKKALIEEVFEDNKLNLVTVMLSINDNAKKTLYYTAFKGNVDLFKFIINTYLVDIEANDDNGFTIAQNVMQKGNNDLIKSIITGESYSWNSDNNGSHGSSDADLLEVNKNDLAYISSNTTHSLGLREIRNLT